MKKTNNSVSSNYVTLVTEPTSETALICFHFAGGSAQSFITWKPFSAEVCDLIVAELPGRGRRFGETTFSSISEAATCFADAYKGLSKKNCIFFGHSLGAILAYETARELYSRGSVVPSRLIVSARSAPCISPASIGLPELSDSALLTYLRDLQGTPQVVLENKSLMDLMTPVLRADLELIYGYEYQPSPPFNIPINVIGGTDDKFVSFESLLKWREVTTGEFHLQMIKGKHFTVLKQPDKVYEIINEFTTNGTKRTDLIC